MEGGKEIGYLAALIAACGARRKAELHVQSCCQWGLLYLESAAVEFRFVQQKCIFDSVLRCEFDVGEPATLCQTAAEHLLEDRCLS